MYQRYQRPSKYSTICRLIGAISVLFLVYFIFSTFISIATMAKPPKYKLLWLPIPTESQDRVEIDVYGCADPKKDRRVSMYYRKWQNGPFGENECFFPWSKAFCTRVANKKEPLKAKDVPLLQEDTFSNAVLSHFQTPLWRAGKARNPDTSTIVFAITTTNSDVELFHRSLSSIYSPDHYYLIHVERLPNVRYPDIFEKLLERLMDEYPNIFVVPYQHSFRTVRFGATVQWVEWTLMKYALELWSDWKFYVTFPITSILVKPIDELATYLTDRDTSFIDYKVDSSWWKDAFEFCYVECSGTAFYFSEKSCAVDQEEKQYWSRFKAHGSRWRILKRDLVNKIFFDPDGRNQFIRSAEFFRTVSNAEETWLQTILESLGLLKDKSISHELPFLSSFNADEMNEEIATEMLIQEALQKNYLFFVREVPTELQLRTFQETILHIEVDTL